MRFTDPLTRLGRFRNEILVRCPECARRATVQPPPDRPDARSARRLTCLNCGHTAEWTAPRRYDGRMVIPALSWPEDPYFGLPLWLQEPCCHGNVLWAYNVEHLNLLESYLRAGLRERGAMPGSMSMVERLPAWLKAGGHRDEALRTIRRVRAKLE